MAFRVSIKQETRKFLIPSLLFGGLKIRLCNNICVRFVYAKVTLPPIVFSGESFSSLSANLQTGVIVGNVGAYYAAHSGLTCYFFNRKRVSRILLN